MLVWRLGIDGTRILGAKGPGSDGGQFRVAGVHPANGQGSAPVIDKVESPLWDAFLAGLTEAAIKLSRAIVRDGEGATKVAAIEVVGARSDEDAHNAARRVSISPLVKTAFYGSDANRGRILCAAGNSEAAIAPEETSLFISADGGPELQLVAKGTPPGYAEEDAAAIFAETEVGVRIDGALGLAACQPAAGNGTGLCRVTAVSAIRDQAPHLFTIPGRGCGSRNPDRARGTGSGSRMWITCPLPSSCRRTPSCPPA